MYNTFEKFKIDMSLFRVYKHFYNKASKALWIQNPCTKKHDKNFDKQFDGRQFSVFSGTAKGMYSFSTKISSLVDLSIFEPASLSIQASFHHEEPLETLFWSE